MHVILRGDEALNEVAGDDISYKRLLAQRLNLNLPYHPDWEGKVGKLKIEDLARRLGPLLVKAGETGDPSGVTGYDVTYRVQSLFAAHANLSTINQYLKTGETSWAVELNPPAPFPAIGMTPALHTLHLAKYVFDAFGISTDGIEPLWDKLIASVKSKTND